MKHRSLVLISLFVVTLPATVAGAQSISSSDDSVRVRHGFFVSGGAGIANAVLDCTVCSRNRKSGPVAYVRIGGTINPHLRLGIESVGWTTTMFELTDRVGFVTADLYVYPTVTSNFWLKGGFGLTAGKETVPGHEVNTTGAAFAAGVGYDWNVGRGNFVIGQFATYFRQLSGSFKSDGADLGLTANTNMLDLGIGLGYRH